MTKVFENRPDLSKISGSQLNGAVLAYLIDLYEKHDGRVFNVLSITLYKHFSITPLQLKYAVNLLTERGFIECNKITFTVHPVKIMEALEGRV